MTVQGHASLDEWLTDAVAYTETCIVENGTIVPCVVGHTDEDSFFIPLVSETELDPPMMVKLLRVTFLAHAVDRFIHITPLIPPEGWPDHHVFFIGVFSREGSRSGLFGYPRHDPDRSLRLLQQMPFPAGFERLIAPPETLTAENRARAFEILKLTGYSINPVTDDGIFYGDDTRH